MPTECGGSWSGRNGSCSFQCSAGDILYVKGSGGFDGRGASVRVRASCGGAILECFTSQSFIFAYAVCEATSAGSSGASFYDQNGSCVVEGMAGDTFVCGSSNHVGN